MRDVFQLSPEGIFKADAGLVSINDDGPFYHRGFHRVPPPRRYRYRYMADSEQAGIIHYRRSADTAPCVIYAESELGLFSY